MICNAPDAGKTAKHREKTRVREKLEKGMAATFYPDSEKKANSVLMG
jgi:hypothetical protein